MEQFVILNWYFTIGIILCVIYFLICIGISFGESKNTQNTQKILSYIALAAIVAGTFFIIAGVITGENNDNAEYVPVTEKICTAIQTEYPDAEVVEDNNAHSLFFKKYKGYVKFSNGEMYTYTYKNNTDNGIIIVKNTKNNEVQNVIKMQK